MHKHLIKGIVLVCICAVFFSGCNPNLDAGNLGSETWKETSAFSWGMLESDKLEPLAWNSGRLEATSNHRMIESENGFYYSFLGRLWYTDRDNMGNWVLVCNQPDCDHFQLDCHSVVETEWIAAKDGRLYFTQWAKSLYDSSVPISLMVSTNQAGEDKKIACIIEEGGSLYDARMINIICDSKWLYSLETIDLNGSSQNILFVVTDAGRWTFEAPKDAPFGYVRDSRFLGLYGDPYFYWTPWSSDHLLKFQDGELLEYIPLSVIPEYGGYLSGNVIRGFAANDGYYDINIETGEKVKIADARMENSFSVIMAPNCIIESTKLGLASANNTQCKIEIFDGICWRTVQLPKELETLGKDSTLSVLGIASDAILINRITYSNASEQILYRIPLKEDELQMQYLATIKQPVKEDEP